MSLRPLYHSNATRTPARSCIGLCGDQHPAVPPRATRIDFYSKSWYLLLLQSHKAPFRLPSRCSCLPSQFSQCGARPPALALATAVLPAAAAEGEEYTQVMRSSIKAASTAARMMAALNSVGPWCGTSSFVLAERAPGASSSRFGSSAKALTSASIVRFDGLPRTNTPAGVFCLMSAALIAAAVGGSFAQTSSKVLAFSPSGRALRVTSGLASACRPYGILVDEVSLARSRKFIDGR